MTRCCNLDWLEVHVLESATNYPCNADYYRTHGWTVREREYGTRVYHEMFTLHDRDDEPFIEIRRNPKSDSNLKGILDPHSSHIRLSNRYCYHPQAINLLRRFLLDNAYTFRRIFRLDICLDFERFDSGDLPQDFVRRYIQHKYAKINQANRTTHGRDAWNGCEDNYISWGNPKSMVSTKLYNKSLELTEAHDKPYIKQAWMMTGLITNPLTGVKEKPDGTRYVPVIWRLEFSLHDGSAGWLILEDFKGQKRKLHPVNHRLEDYDTDEKLIVRFAALADHYFHFKHYEANQRKDRCKDKVLFFWKLGSETRYKLQRLASSQNVSTDEQRFLRKLIQYRDSHYMPEVRKACDVLINYLQERGVNTFVTRSWSDVEVEKLRQLLRFRLAKPEVELKNAVRTIEQIFKDDMTWF